MNDDLTIKQAVGAGCRDLLIVLPIICVISLFQDGWVQALWSLGLGMPLAGLAFWLTRGWR